MRLLHLPSLMLSVALLGSSSAIAAQPDQTVHHLTCTKNQSGLMCTIDETQESVTVKLSTADQLEQLSNDLIAVMFIGLPIALVLVILLHHKRDVDRAKRLERLEKIWRQS
ncbi:hypothetical protein ACQ4M3_31340 [Leptolyngbya sp. AN03gr2]|uniref:hypothetical protein n=1 Tax=unclassified Leptolyngbya TaxID=2650499 RepID=UPI003D31F059